MTHDIDALLLSITEAVLTVGAFVAGVVLVVNGHLLYQRLRGRSREPYWLPSRAEWVELALIIAVALFFMVQPQW